MMIFRFVAHKGQTEIDTCTRISTKKNNNLFDKACNLFLGNAVQIAIVCTLSANIAELDSVYRSGCNKWISIGLDS